MNDYRVVALRDAVGDSIPGRLAALALEVIEERLQVNVGLQAENAKLRKQLGIAA